MNRSKPSNRSSGSVPSPSVFTVASRCSDTRNFTVAYLWSVLASAWVKYDPSVTLCEALTQDWVGQALNASPDAAVRVPKVYHAFEHGAFGEWSRDVLPLSYALLTRGNDRFSHTRVSLNGSASMTKSSMTYPSDINRTNFKKGLQGEIVALDFGATCFLPPSFAIAMAAVEESFTRLMPRYVKYPASANLEAMQDASYLVPFGAKNNREYPSVSRLDRCSARAQATPS